MNSSSYEYLGIAIICFIVAFVLGTSIVTLIDDKINNVSVNLPEIIVPRPNVTVVIDKDNYDEMRCGAIEKFEPLPKDNETDSSAEVKEAKKIKRFVNGTTQKERLDYILNMSNNDIIRNDKPVILYNDVEDGLKKYAVAGCKDRRKKFKMYPNQVACNVPNYLTAENYYNSVFEYPYIPGPSEELYFPSNYNEMDEYGSPNISFRIVNRNAKIINKNPPHPSNYWFKK